jgi:hypothetical protein
MLAECLWWSAFPAIESIASVARGNLASALERMAFVISVSTLQGLFALTRPPSEPTHTRSAMSRLDAMDYWIIAGAIFFFHALLTCALP